MGRLNTLPQNKERTVSCLETDQWRERLMGSIPYRFLGGAPPS